MTESDLIELMLPIGCLSQAVSRFLLSFRGQKMEHEIFAGPDDAH